MPQMMQQRAASGLLVKSLATAAGFAGCALIPLAIGFAGPLQPHRQSLRVAVSSLERQATSSNEEQKSAKEWRMSVGHAIDVLRNDVVELFANEQHNPDFSVFSDDIVFADARVPGFELRGLSVYQSALATLRWSVFASCDKAHVEITSLRPPFNGEVRMRWRLRLWPKDVLAPAKELLAPALGTAIQMHSVVAGTPFTLEGYSVYDFDSWSAQIVKHTIEVTNPPMFIADLLAEHASEYFPSATPALTGLGVPKMWPQVSTLPEKTPAKSLQFTRLGFGFPQTCEDDFECNDGRANFPKQCCEFPLLGNFCCEPDDGYEPMREDPAYVPIPVPADPWQ